jgi:hypothetical protein
MPQILASIGLISIVNLRAACMNSKNKFPLLIILILFLAAALSGCKRDPNDAYIQGSWVYDDPHLATVVAEPNWTERWIFDRGSFADDGCCFGNVSISGSYRILESEGDTITIELYHMDGSQNSTPVNWDTTTSLKITIDRENETIKVGRNGPYTRVR